MKSTDAPSKQAIPFGTNGPREAITPTTPSGSNQASYDQGFPPITMTLKSAGGLPPKGQDMNQILFEQSSFNRYFSAGGGYVYDSAFSTAIGGYPIGARIPDSTGTGFWLNTAEDNTANPENNTAALTGWVPMGSSGVTAITGLTSSSITLTTLQASKDRITLSGTLTANINIVVPAWRKGWQVVNGTTGGFTVTIKTPSGTGVSMPAGTTHYVLGDGTNISEDLLSAAFRSVGNGTNQIPDMSFFGSLSSPSGYQKLPGGIIFQWGVATGSAAGTSTVCTATLPTAFPTQKVSWLGTLSDKAGGISNSAMQFYANAAYSSSLTTVSFGVNSPDSTGTIGIRYFAIGY